MLTVILIYTILIFPIFLTVYINFDKSDNVVFVTFRLFNIKIITISAKLFPKGLFINLTRKKTIIVPLTNLINARKKFAPLKDYHFIKFYFELEMGNYEHAPNLLFASLAINSFFNYFQWFLAHNKPYATIENTLKTHLDKNVFKVKSKLIIVFNLLMILLSLIKILAEKMNYAFKK